MQEEYIHNYTLAQAKKLAKNRAPLISISGHLLCSRDRRPSEGSQFEGDYWSAVAHAIAIMIHSPEKGVVVPLDVQANYKVKVIGNGIAADHPAVKNLPDKKEPATMSTPHQHPVNTKGKKFSWSFSALNDFDPELGGCPKYYGHMRYFFDYPFDDTVEHLVWGNVVHKGLENRLKKKIPLNEDLAKWEKWCVIIEKHAAKVGGEIIVENQFAIDDKFKSCSWFDGMAWGRGIVDVAIVAGDKCWIFDWKTGKVKDNLLQLQIFALFIAFHYPEVKTFIPRFIFLQHDAVRPEGNLQIQRADLKPVLVEVQAKIKRIEDAWRHENFPASPSGLCGWRPCHKECEHFRGRKR